MLRSIALLHLAAAYRKPGRIVDDLDTVAPGTLADQVEPGQARVSWVDVAGNPGARVLVSAWPCVVLMTSPQSTAS